MSKRFGQQQGGNEGYRIDVRHHCTSAQVAALALHCGICVSRWARRHARSARKGGRRVAKQQLSAELKDRDILQVAETAAKAAGRIIVEKQQAGAAVVKATKSNAADLLTEVDEECEDVIRRIVQEKFPDHDFLGEETADDDSESKLLSENWLWVVDPIDGTTNFVAGQPLSAVSIGIAKAGELRVGVIYDPFRDELFGAMLGEGARLNGQSIQVSRTASLPEAVVASGAPPNPDSAAPCFRAMSRLAPPRTRTIRILGSAAINFAWVACGRLDAWFEPDLNAWDSAAGALLVQEAGGQVTDCVGNPYTLSTRPICASNGPIHKALLKNLAKAGATKLDQGELTASALQRLQGLSVDIDTNGIAAATP